MGKKYSIKHFFVLNACRIISFLYICSPQLKRRGIINLKILNNDKGRIDA